MRRALSCIIVLLAVTGCQVGEPGRPAFFVSSDSFPTRPGARRVYHMVRSENDKPVDDWTEERVLTDVNKDVLHYTITRDKKTRDEYVILHNDGAWLWNAPQAPTPGLVGKPPAASTTLAVIFPLVVSVVWDFNDPRIGLIHRDVERQEKIKTAAGEYTAIDIGETGDNGIKGNLWYVPGVGIAKWDIKFGNSPTIGHFVQELTSLSEPPTK